MLTSQSSPLSNFEFPGMQAVTIHSFLLSPSATCSVITLNDDSFQQLNLAIWLATISNYYVLKLDYCPELIGHMSLMRQRLFITHRSINTNYFTNIVSEIIRYDQCLQL